MVHMWCFAQVLNSRSDVSFLFQHNLVCMCVSCGLLECFGRVVLSSSSPGFQEFVCRVWFCGKHNVLPASCNFWVLLFLNI